MSAANANQSPPTKPLMEWDGPQGDPGNIDPQAGAAPGMPPANGQMPNGQMTDIIDIRPLQPPGFDIGSLAPYGVGLLAALILIGGFLLFYHRKRKLKAGVLPELPPEQTAMAALKEISDPSLIEGKVFYYRLSAVLRRYIEQRFGIPALEMTVEEMRPALDQLPADRDLLRRLREMFSDMAPVLYADQGTQDARMEEHLHLVMRFVEATAEVEEEEGNSE